MHVMFVTYDANGISRPAGGVATFISHFSALLRLAGNEVTILYANRTQQPMDVRWQTAYQSQGISVVQVNSDQDINLSVEVATQVQLADVVYFQDWHSHAFYTAQQRRFTSRRWPTCVLVLHGASAWLHSGKNSGPPPLDDLAAEFVEGYSAQHCDFVASPSRAMLSWVESRGWLLPPGEHTRVLGLPLLPADAKSETTIQAATFKRIVFFGRREKHKGFELFVDALLLLAKQESECLRDIDEIVFLGAENLTSDAAGTRFGRSGDASELLTASTGKPVTSLKHLDSLGAQQYLTERAADTLVVIPSLVDNFPYTAIETSIIPGLNLLCAKTGGLPEILGPDQLFEPDPESMAACLSTWLRHGPLPDDQLSHYDFGAANRRWLDFHDTVSQYKAEPQSQDAATTRTTSIAVCVRYSRESQHLAELLLSLACQTSQQFAVVVSADGPQDVQSTAVFEQMQAQYSDRGWAFLQRPGETTALARNAMANETQATYLCFVDADTVAAPTMIERLSQAIRQSGDHCLAFPGYVFNGESSPYDLQARQITSEDRADLPSVPNPLLEVFDNIPEAVGLVVHREAFNSIDGYATDCPEALLDKDLYLRLILAGYKVDYLPEYLCFVRSSTLVVPPRTETVTFVSRRLDASRVQPGKVQLGALTLLIRSLQAQVEALKPSQSQANRQAVEPPLANQSGKLKILMLLPYFPIAPRTGALIRFWEQIRFWGSHHDLTVVTFISPGEEQIFEDMLQPYTTNRVGVIYKKPYVSAQSDLPDSVQLYTTPAMMRALQDIVPAKFDVAIVEQIFMGEYRSLLKGLTILTEHNVEYAIPRQITGLAQQNTFYGEFSKAAASYKKQSRLMENYEKRMWPRFSLRIAVSEKDQQEMHRHCRTGRTVVVENGTYTNRFITDLNPHSKNILFMGALRYYPNIDGLLYFIDAMWPLLRQRDPDLQLIVAGRSPDPRIISAATQPHVRLIADPNDMADVARECSLSIVPLRVGGGTRIKILDSLAMGLPVVTTSLGCEGLAAQDGTHLLVRDAPTDFAEAVVQLTTDLPLWSKLRHNGYQFVRNSFSWDRLFEKMGRCRLAGDQSAPLDSVELSDNQVIRLMSAIKIAKQPTAGLAKLIQNRPISQVLIQLAILIGAMLVAAQLRYQLPYGSTIPQIDMARTLAVCASLIVVTLVVHSAAYVLGSGFLAAQPEKRALIIYLLSLVAAVIVTAYFFPDVSRVQLLYFGVAGIALYAAAIMWPAHLARTAGNNTLTAHLVKLYDQRILLSTWVKYNIQSRYSQAILGVLWIILLPISISLIMALVFSDFLHAQVGNVPFIVFLLPAIVPWGLFNYGVMTGTRSVLGMMHLITQIYFPREILVLVTLGEGIVDLFFTFLAMLFINALNNVWPNVWYIYLPILLIIQVCFTLGVMFYVSSLSILVRDIPPLVAVLLQLAFYLTPIFYSIQAIPPRFQILTVINPLAILIQSYRDIIVNGQPPDGAMLFYPAVVALVLLYTGYSFFKANEGEFADYL